ncbi:MAG: hypothetical protein JOZ05_15850 [Acetobacteraceae bacterium]|nr:hypothetical protein [Acetobacteraceae bacterium]
MHDALASVLRTACRHRINEPNAEAGFARIRELTRSTLTDASLAEAVSACVAARYIKDPVRLEEGALQCRWTLELTAEGVAAAAPLTTAARRSSTPSPE